MSSQHGSVLLAAIVVGLGASDAAGQEKLEPRLLEVKPDDSILLDLRPHLHLRFNREKSRVGVQLPALRDPLNPTRFMRLTYQEDGSNNNCCLKIGEAEYLFGNAPPGSWIPDERGNLVREKQLPNARHWLSAMVFPERVCVYRQVRLLPGWQTRLLDTVLVCYEIENRSNREQVVGLREMIDTYIGNTDGLPFAVPGEGRTDTLFDSNGRPVPPFVQASEQGNPITDAVVLHLGLDLPGLERADRLVLCHWPDEFGSEVRWQWRFRAINNPPENKDSCAVIYWRPLPLAPKARRYVGYTLGLAPVSRSANGQLGLTVGGPSAHGLSFTVMAYSHKPQPGQVLALRLPEGLALAKSEKVQQTPRGDKLIGLASWRVTASDKAAPASPIEAILLGNDGKEVGKVSMPVPIHPKVSLFP